MTQEFIPYEQALELKELGFKYGCQRFYNKNKKIKWSFANGLGQEYFNQSDAVAAPLYQQAFRWFDENTSFQGFVIASLKEGHFDWEILNLDTEEKIECKEYYHTRLEAELACLKKLIEIVKNK